MNKLDYSQVLKFVNINIPQDLEDEFLTEYARITGEKDLAIDDLFDYYTELQLNPELFKLMDKSMVCIEGTNIVDFDKLLKSAYHLLIFMDNEHLIDKQWSTLIEHSQRSKKFQNIPLKNHVITIKDLQDILIQLNMDQSQIVDMISCITNGKRDFITYIDFAYLLGKMGSLRY